MDDACLSTVGRAKILAINLIRKIINTWYYSQLKINPVGLVNKRCLHGHYIPRSINREPIELITTITDESDASTGAGNSQQFNQTRCSPANPRRGILIGGHW